jgi:hypothetical protein
MGMHILFNTTVFELVAWWKKGKLNGFTPWSIIILVHFVRHFAVVRVVRVLHQMLANKVQKQKKKTSFTHK